MERLKTLEELSLRAIDGIITAPIYSGDTSFPSLIKAIVLPGRAKTERLQAGLHIANKAIPGLVPNLAKMLSSRDKFPLVGKNFKLLSYGGESLIFNVSDQEMVLKLRRLTTLSMNTEQLLAEVHRLRTEYDTIKSWYQSVPGDFIPPELIVLVHGYLFAQPTIAIIQPRINDQIKDVFEDYSQEDLLLALKRSNLLHQQFSIFVQTSLQLYDQQKTSIDLLGLNNLCILEKDDSPMQLLLLDPHVIYTPELLAQRTAETSVKLEERINYLRSVRNELQFS